MRLLLIGHDANRAGAQLVLLYLMRLLKADGIAMHLLLGEGGPLEADYRALAPVTIWPQTNGHLVSPNADKVLGKLGLWHRQANRRDRRHQRTIAQELKLGQVDAVLVNTVSGAQWLRQLPLADNVPVIAYLHELTMSVQLYTRPDDLRYLFSRAQHLLTVSEATAQFYESRFQVPADRISLFTLIDVDTIRQRVAEASQPNSHGRPLLDVPADAVVVGGCGNAEWRKGNDLFVALARMVNQLPGAPVYFVWVGMPPSTLRDDLWHDVEKAGLTDHVRFIEPTSDVLRYMARFDVFLLCSREDPYPLVVLEAGASQLPVVCFAGAGGAPELIEDDGGAVVPYLDLNAMAAALRQLANDPARRQQQGHRLSQKIDQRHNSRRSIDQLLSLLNQLTTA
ncbi:glycosyltransferase family 4 protein [Fibrella sp. WM1]|uniref:glycosyltransferase family 4 protein n=1 Tax=Fibrella musci TaxID=3242485 RepID=UPI0035229DC3